MTAAERQFVITGISPEGRSVFIHSGAANQVPDAGLTGVAYWPMWSTPDGPALVGATAGGEIPDAIWFPEPGGTRFFVVAVPPGKGCDRAESAYHTTETVDYGVVLSGEIVLELDADERRLPAGSCVVQRGTRHRWRNEQPEPAVLLFLILGAERLG